MKLLEKILIISVIIAAVIMTAFAIRSACEAGDAHDRLKAAYTELREQNSKE